MDTKALRDEFAQVQHDAQALITLTATEKRAYTAAEKTANEQRYARLDQIKALFDEERRFAALALEKGTVELPAEPQGRAEFNAAEGRQVTDNAGANAGLQFEMNGKRFDLNAYKKALNTFAQTGQMRQEFTVTSTTQSGAFLPKEVLNPITVKRLQNAWRGVLDATGFKPIELSRMETISLPVADDTANVGQAQSESATAGTTQDADNTKSLTIAPTLYGSKQMFFSNTMILAQSFDVMAFVLPILQKRVDKVQESTWTTAIMATGTVGKTTASPTVITYAELMAWEHSLAAAYRTDACFVLSDTLYQALRGLVDSNNRPVMDLDPTNVFAAKIHNRPVLISDYFQTLAANHIMGAFVSGSALQIVDILNTRMARYAGLPQFPDQVGFELFHNGDQGFVPQGLSLIKSAIS